MVTQYLSLYCHNFIQKRMTYKLVCSVSNQQIGINLPEAFKNKRRVTVIIDDHANQNNDKFLEMLEAIHDPLFLEDVADTLRNFAI